MFPNDLVLFSLAAHDSILLPPHTHTPYCHARCNRRHTKTQKGPQDHIKGNHRQERLVLPVSFASCLSCRMWCVLPPSSSQLRKTRSDRETRTDSRSHRTLLHKLILPSSLIALTPARWWVNLHVAMINGHPCKNAISPHEIHYVRWVNERDTLHISSTRSSFYLMNAGGWMQCSNNMTWINDAPAPAEVDWFKNK